MKIQKILFLVITFQLFFTALQAQSYSQTILQHREKYAADFLTDYHSPLHTKEEISFLRFYSPNKTYRVLAKISKVKDTEGFTMLTHSGKQKQYFKYALITFTIQNKARQLYIYQSKELMKNPDLADYLFLPFTDVTNNVSTFGGGRYLDFRLADCKGSTMILDFNKCYNPYCAFGEGYSCPIPPKENDLPIEILAGEKLYGKQENAK